MCSILSQGLEGSDYVPTAEESIWLATLSPAEREELNGGNPQPPLDRPDVLIVGGGLVGLAVAYFAAERGARVQVLAESRVAQDAEASLGCIIPNACRWQFSAATQVAAQASRDWWAKLAVRPEFQLDWRVCGALLVDEQRLAPDPQQHMLAALDAGYSVHAVDAGQVAWLEPNLAACPLGGLHYPSEAVLNPLRAACGFIRGLRRRGGQVAIGTVSRLELAGDRLNAVESSVGSIHPKWVFAADPKTFVRYGESLPLPGPHFETRHSLFLASTPQPPLLQRPILDAAWMVQLKSGEIVIEVPVEEPGDSADAVLGRLKQRLPAVGQLEWRRTWTGTSQRAADRCPVVHKVASLDNTWSCGGLDFATALFAPIIGKGVADWMLTGRPIDELTAFTGASR